MWRFNTLDYFVIPTPERRSSFPLWLPIEIGVLSGRLYFDYGEYPSLISWLGINQEGLLGDGANVPSMETGPIARGLFVEQPLKFLQEWLTYRRQTQDIMHTPMGYLCQKKKLDSRRSFFIFTESSQDVSEPRPGTQGGATTVNTESEIGVSDDDSDWGEVEDELILPGGE
jgi:hypothetical protein